jgi:hypothetical protein
MDAKFYTDSGNPLWDGMKHNICRNILDNTVADTRLRYYVHFDKMIFLIGWFFGFVEIWKGKRPHKRNRRRIPFAVHVTDWGCREDCRKRPSYRVSVKG